LYFAGLSATYNKMSALEALSPLDGRYADKVARLRSYFSEFALIRYRIWVEIEYLIVLGKLLKLEGVLGHLDQLHDFYHNFSLLEAARVKEIETKTQHDVKAVEYYLREALAQWLPDPELCYIHFGLTSQDINNTALPLMLSECSRTVLWPMIRRLVGKLDQMSIGCYSLPMLARTHGQPASPTTLGKELRVFVERLTLQYQHLIDLPFSAKFGGATGNFNAHMAAYPCFDWCAIADDFVQSFGLVRMPTTTQIEPYDNLAAYCHALARINTILIDLCRDLWSYISLGYFFQKIPPELVGSSTMPHKVNPIQFENAEGNLGWANAGLEHMARKLPISRLQRDLTDSTVLRNLGVPLGHSILAYQALMQGLSSLAVNVTVMTDDLNQHWEVLTEAVQTILRREGHIDAYELLKAFARQHPTVTRQKLHEFISSLDVSEKVKDELRALTPFNYVGTAGNSAKLSGLALAGGEDTQ